MSSGASLLYKGRWCIPTHHVGAEALMKRRRTKDKNMLPAVMKVRVLNLQYGQGFYDLDKINENKSQGRIIFTGGGCTEINFMSG
jgi:hypothetical protein